MDTKASSPLLAAVCVALAFALVGLGLALPAGALADGGLAAGAARPKYHQLEGTAYFSRSHDAKFCVSDGETSRVLLANAPVDLAEVCQVDLDDYGLGAYKLAAPEGAPYEYECTLLQLFVYAAERFAANGSVDMQITGEPRHSYIKKYWGEDENFLYYLNGAYPMDASLGAGQGATSDAIPLRDGDVLTVAHYSYWDFHTDPDAGFHFFVDGAGDLAHTYLARAGEPVEVRLARASEGSGSSTDFAPEPGWRVWWGSAYDDSDANLHAAGSATTGEDGSAQLTFGSPGTYYVWADGGKGASTNRIVSSPACARVVVSDASAPAPAVVVRPHAVDGLVYDGTEQAGVAAGDGAAQVENVMLSGTVAATDAGDYVAHAAPADGFTWPDGTARTIDVSWSIAPAPITGAEVRVESSGAGMSAAVSLGGRELGPGDFEASFSASFASDAGTAVVAVTARGHGNYCGTATAQFESASDAVLMRVDPARAAFTGSRVTPRVEVLAGGSALPPEDYTLRYVNQATGSSSRVAPISAGSYRVVATVGADASARIGYDSVSVSAPFEIYEPSGQGDPVDPGGQAGRPDAGGSAGGAAAAKADSLTAAAKAPKANPMKVTAKSVKVKAKKLKKKARTVAAVTVTGAEGAVTYKIVKIKTKKKLAKQARKKIKLVPGGKLKLKKKLKKGTYKVTVRVAASGNGQFEPATKDVTVKVKVK